MIHIDISLPFIHKEMECFCDEKLIVDRFIEEILDLVEERNPGGNMSSENQRQEEDSFWLCDLSRGTRLDHRLTLRQNGVCSGHRLMLI